MAIDTDKIDETVLALLQLTLHDGARALEGARLGGAGPTASQGHDRKSSRQGEVRCADGSGTGGERAVVQRTVRQSAGTMRFDPVVL